MVVYCCAFLNYIFYMTGFSTVMYKYRKDILFLKEKRVLISSSFLSCYGNFCQVIHSWKIRRPWEMNKKQHQTKVLFFNSHMYWLWKNSHDRIDLCVQRQKQRWFIFTKQIISANRHWRKSRRGKREWWTELTDAEIPRLT